MTTEGTFTTQSKVIIVDNNQDIFNSIRNTEDNRSRFVVNFTEGSIARRAVVEGINDLEATTNVGVFLIQTASRNGLITSIENMQSITV